MGSGALRLVWSVSKVEGCHRYAPKLLELRLYCRRSVSHALSAWRQCVEMRRGRPPMRRDAGFNAWECDERGRPSLGKAKQRFGCIGC